jgi:hypothetical protein
MPILGAPALTEAAIADVLAQSVPTRLLLINQGVDDAFRRRLEQIAEEYPERVYLWSHQPSLPSLAATWNRALQFVWEVGGTEALVVNNDVRLHPVTYGALRLNLRDRSDALFISALGVTGEQYEAWSKDALWTELSVPPHGKGGPDFSCFLISKEGHEKYPFDEHLTPSFCEDLDLHRRFMLGGDGDRIFSIHLPFHHVGGGSNTLKSMTPEARAAHEQRISTGSRAYYARKWGGGVNEERWTIPFDPSTDQDGVTTPDLQRAIQGASDGR